MSEILPQPDFEILFVSHKYPPATGGMEKQSFELIEGVSKLTKVHHILFQREESIFMFFWKLNKRILNKIKAHPNIRLIHFNDGLIASLSLRHKGYTHLQKALTLHGLDVVFPLRYFQHKIVPQFEKFDLIIAVSHATADAIIRRGIPAEKIVIVPNGVDNRLARGSQNISNKENVMRKYPQLNLNQPYLLTLGRPVKRKGFSWFINDVIPLIPQDVQLVLAGPFQRKTTFFERFIDLLPKKYYQLITLFLGYPSDEKAIRSLLKQPSINRQVKHLGKVAFDDLQILLANATAFLMPNIYVDGDMEGFGLVCLEASISGTLVLASEIEGITDAIQHHKNGILLTSKDPIAWRNQIQQVLSNPDDYRQLAQEYREYTIQHYDWDKMAISYFDAFKAIVKSNVALTRRHSETVF
ncbi:glycosyltransferase family 4 protein [Sphingobacterium olei]|uniref:Glycosyltransferase family 4 protein n=1 Tax=Sphingobacterium olei TaxID=2571155 RepID=A0A4U0NEE8_9SPHI|nr:glycosyltransferase family 4 protein [Sphingobacterium olei]TJZ52419.1 glycosyltransferase family 4 protein [Sphingobacterium olei]